MNQRENELLLKLIEWNLNISIIKEKKKNWKMKPRSSPFIVVLFHVDITHILFIFHQIFQSLINGSKTFI